MRENIGSKIKHLRKQKNMTLEEVSKLCSLSASFLSQVERSKSSVTFTSLRKIAEALNVDITYFFDEEEGLPENKKINRDKQTILSNAKFSFSKLSGNIENPDFEPYLITLFPKDESEIPYSHRGQEFIYILDGSLTVVLEDNKFILNPGEHFHIDSSIPHMWYNNTDKLVKMLFVVS